VVERCAQSCLHHSFCSSRCCRKARRSIVIRGVSADVSEIIPDRTSEMTAVAATTQTESEEQDRQRGGANLNVAGKCRLRNQGAWALWSFATRFRIEPSFEVVVFQACRRVGGRSFCRPTSPGRNVVPDVSLDHDISGVAVMKSDTSTRDMGGVGSMTGQGSCGLPGGGGTRGRRR
jgi:hypothetical protein